MKLTINGEPHEVDAAMLSDVVPPGSVGVAVAVNGSVVPRGIHDSHPLADGDVIDIVTATQGG
jgi:sulfur carrier protein